MTDLAPFRLAEQAAAELTRRLDGEHDVAMVLGSGWAQATKALGPPDAEVAFTDLPGFPAPSVPGHGSSVISLSVGGGRALLFGGRVHLYEGHDVGIVALPVRTAILAGCQRVVLSNGCGGINPAFGVGQVVALSDHLNMTGASPLWGPSPPDPYAIRFTDLTDAYSTQLRAIARSVDPDLAEGVYAGLPGPHYETPAEIEMLRTMGADMVGMSTVLETIAARHLGAEVLGLSMVTNAAASTAGQALSHDEVIEAGREAGDRLGGFVSGLLAALVAER